MFSEIYDFYVVRIFRFVYLKTSSKETAEDLASEVFLKYWKRIKKGMKNKSLGETIANDKIKSFLYKIARNLIIDLYRKKEVLTVEIDDSIKDRMKDQKQDILACISAKQEVEEIMKALHQIKGEYRGSDGNNRKDKQFGKGFVASSNEGVKISSIIGFYGYFFKTE